MQRNTLERRTEKLVQFFRTLERGDVFYEVDAGCAARFTVVEPLQGSNPRVVVRRDSGVEIVLYLADFMFCASRFARELEREMQVI